MAEKTCFQDFEKYQISVTGDQKNFKYILRNEDDSLFLLKVFYELITVKNGENDRENEQLLKILDMIRVVQSPTSIGIIDKSLNNGYQKAGDYHWIITDFVPGATLSALFLQPNHFTLRSTFEILIGIASELKVIHKHELVHGYVNPKHIMIDSLLHPHLLKYDTIVREGEEGSQPDKNFYPKESFRDEEVMRRTNDIYAFGILIKCLIAHEDAVYTKNMDDIDRNLALKRRGVDKAFLTLADMCIGNERMRPSMDDIYTILREGALKWLTPQDPELLNMEQSDLYQLEFNKRIKVYNEIADYYYFKSYLDLLEKKTDSIPLLGTPEMVKIAIKCGFTKMNQNLEYAQKIFGIYEEQSIEVYINDPNTVIEKICPSMRVELPINSNKTRKPSLHDLSSEVMEQLEENPPERQQSGPKVHFTSLANIPNTRNIMDIEEIIDSPLEESKSPLLGNSLEVPHLEESKEPSKKSKKNPAKSKITITNKRRYSEGNKLSSEDSLDEISSDENPHVETKKKTKGKKSGHKKSHSKSKKEKSQEAAAPKKESKERKKSVSASSSGSSLTTTSSISSISSGEVASSSDL